MIHIYIYVQYIYIWYVCAWKNSKHLHPNKAPWISWTVGRILRAPARTGFRCSNSMEHIIVTINTFFYWHNMTILGMGINWNWSRNFQWCIFLWSFQQGTWRRSLFLPKLNSWDPSGGFNPRIIVQVASVQCHYHLSIDRPWWWILINSFVCFWISWVMKEAHVPLIFIMALLKPKECLIKWQSSFGWLCWVLTVLRSCIISNRVPSRYKVLRLSPPETCGDMSPIEVWFVKQFSWRGCLCLWCTYVTSSFSTSFFSGPPAWHERWVMSDTISTDRANYSHTPRTQKSKFQTWLNNTLHSIAFWTLMIYSGGSTRKILGVNAISMRTPDRTPQWMAGEQRLQQRDERLRAIDSAMAGSQ